MIKWNGSFGLKKKTKLEFFVISMFSLMLFINAFSICFSCGNLLFRGVLQKSK